MDNFLGSGGNTPTTGQYYDVNSALEAKQIGYPSLQQRLDGAVREAEARLAEAKEARDILSRNPDLERLLNIMQRGRF